MSNPIKNASLLQETNRDFDFFDFEQSSKNLYSILQSNDKPSVTALIGGYGTGKSVLLNETRKLSDTRSRGKSPKWVVFECWQYPDKNDLWEGFIVELVRAIGGDEKSRKMQMSYSAVGSWRDWLAKYTNKTGVAIATLVGAIVCLLLIGNDDLRREITPLLTAFIVVLFASVELLVRPDSKSNVSRLSDYKNELMGILTDYKGLLYVVLEDVDRAGDQGGRFFEAVSHFVRDDELKNSNIKLIVPIADTKQTNNTALRNSIEKASDNILYFKPSYDSSTFLSEVFTSEFLDKPTMELLRAIINLTLRSISIRDMKHILRNAVAKYNRLKRKIVEPSLTMCIAVEFFKRTSGQHGDRTIYEEAMSGSSFKHDALYSWAEQKGLLSLKSSDETKEIRSDGQFMRSSELFLDIQPEDVNTHTSTGGKMIHNRRFLISRAYFDDL